jgi:two-component system NarL family sensor kinase
MNFTREEKIKKLEAEITRARTPKHKCSLLIDMAMGLRHSNPAVSLHEAQKALSLSEEINFELGRARSYFCMGLVHFHLSDYEKAFVFLDNSFHIFDKAGDKWGTSNALNNIGLIHLRLGDYAKALEHFSSSLQIKKESGDRFGTANVMISMAAIHRESGNPLDAQLLLAESLQISEELKSDELTSKGLMEFGMILMKENKFSEATEKFLEAKGFFEKQNNLSGIAQCFLELGKIRSAAGDVQHAVSLFGQGQIIANEAGDKSLLTVFLCNNAAEKLRSNKPLEAISLLHNARKIAIKAQEKPMLTMIAQQLSAAYEATDNVRDALLEYKNFIALKDEINTIETATRLRNQQISAKMEVLVKENKLLEMEKMAAIAQFTSLLNTQEIKSLNAMMEGQEKERKRIAADLHDRIGSSLSAIKLHLGSFARSQEGPSQAQNNLARVSSMFDDVVKEVRQVSHDLASGVLIKFGLVPALKDLGESIESAGKIKVNFFTIGSDERLDHLTEIALYRITQELISNILRHAQAKEINIHFNHHNGYFSLMVEDDGIGFDPAKASGGLGMNNIRSRANQLNGTIFFDSLPGNGCTVTIEIPVKTKL